MDRLRGEIERIEIAHGLCSHSAHGQPALEKFLNKVTAHDRSFFICTRGDLLSGNIGRILRVHPSQAIFLIQLVDVSNLGTETRNLFPKDFQMIHTIRIPHFAAGTVAEGVAPASCRGQSVP